MLRLPIIRHIRWLIYSWRVERHYEMWRQLGYLPVHIDQDVEVLNAIWRGER
jgi:hypothetical protein